MYRYAVNLSPTSIMCDCEDTWDEENGWTEEMYTGDIYNCQLVECPYDDATVCDFYEDEEGFYIFDEESYLSRKKEIEYETELMKQKSLLNDIQRKQIMKSINDVDAYSVRYLYPIWSGSSVSYKKDERVIHNDEFFKCLQDHISQESWSPDAAPSLWVRISNPNDEWPDWIQPLGAHDAYTKGAKVTHNGKKWISDIDANVWEPGTPSSNWTEYTEN